ncbi:unnamed protein product [Coccothraustes coccothraustes]
MGRSSARHGPGYPVGSVRAEMLRPGSAGCGSCAGRRASEPRLRAAPRMGTETTDGHRQTEEHQETRKILVSIIGSDLSIAETDEKQSTDSMGLQKMIREEYVDHIKPVEDKLDLN